MLYEHSQVLHEPLELTVCKMGLFLASVIIPSQCPKFFSKERSEKFAAALSEVRST